MLNLILLSFNPHIYLVGETEFNGLANWPLPGTSREKPESQDTEQPFEGGIPPAHEDILVFRHHHTGLCPGDADNKKWIRVIIMLFSCPMYNSRLRKRPFEEEGTYSYNKN